MSIICLSDAFVWLCCCRYPGTVVFKLCVYESELESQGAGYTQLPTQLWAEMEKFPVAAAGLMAVFCEPSL